MMKTPDLDSGNLLKTLPYHVKTMTYDMLKFISLTVTNFAKIALCVTDPAKCLLFVSKIVLFFGF